MCCVWIPSVHLIKSTFKVPICDSVKEWKPTSHEKCLQATVDCISQSTCCSYLIIFSCTWYVVFFTLCSWVTSTPRPSPPLHTYIYPPSPSPFPLHTPPSRFVFISSSVWSTVIASHHPHPTWLSFICHFFFRSPASHLISLNRRSRFR